MSSPISHGQSRESINKRRLVGFLVGLPLYFALFMFLPAGTWAWTAGWLFIVVFLVTMLIAGLVLWRVNPDVVAARTRTYEGTKPWDRILVPLVLAAVFAIPPVAGFDAGRFHWFPVPTWVVGLGYVLFVIGFGIVGWAEAVNKFFEVTVRIQSDRGQTVIDTGPYAIVRHPGYVGAFFFCVGIALSLGSVWALVPAGLACALFILRTRWEDETLQAELPGYREYTQRTRYRLLPGVW